MQKALFTLLRLGLETEAPSEEGLKTIATLSEQEWAQLGELAEKQGVLAIVLDGIEKCQTNHADNLPLDLKLEWIGEVMMIEQAYQQQMAVMNDVSVQKCSEGI